MGTRSSVTILALGLVLFITVIWATPVGGWNPAVVGEEKATTNMELFSVSAIVLLIGLYATFKDFTKE